MAQIRGFDPSLVQRRHVFPKTLVFGSDGAGIKLRLDRFEEVLTESGDAPLSYASAAEAIGYISSGDMFSDSICVVVRDISDALATSTESKRLYASLLRSIATYGEDSTIVIGAPQSKPSSALSRLVKDFEGLGGVCREVSAPDMSSVARWLDEYLKSISLEMSQSDRSKVLEVSEGDVSVLQEIISSVGSEIPNLSAGEIAQWLDWGGTFSPSDIRAMVSSRDIPAMSSMCESLSNTTNGYRMFLLKVRAATLDLLVASCGGAQPLLTLKQGMYPNSNGKVAYFIAKETSASDYGWLAVLYTELNRQIDALAVGANASFEQLVLSIARAG